MRKKLIYQDFLFILICINLRSKKMVFTMIKKTKMRYKKEERLIKYIKMNESKKLSTMLINILSFFNFLICFFWH